MNSNGKAARIVGTNLYIAFIARGSRRVETIFTYIGGD